MLRDMQAGVWVREECALARRAVARTRRRHNAARSLLRPRRRRVAEQYLVRALAPGRADGAAVAELLLFCFVGSGGQGRRSVSVFVRARQKPMSHPPHKHKQVRSCASDAPTRSNPMQLTAWRAASSWKSSSKTRSSGPSGKSLHGTVLAGASSACCCCFRPRLPALGGGGGTGQPRIVLSASLAANALLARTGALDLRVFIEVVAVCASATQRLLLQALTSARGQWTCALFGLRPSARAAACCSGLSLARQAQLAIFAFRHRCACVRLLSI